MKTMTFVLTNLSFLFIFVLGCDNPGVVNSRVNEHTFVKVAQDGREAAAVEILGTPTRQGKGEVVKYESGAEMAYLISMDSEESVPDHYRIYENPNGEEVHLLYKNSGDLVAAEYRVNGTQIYYCGKREPCRGLGMPGGSSRNVEQSPNVLARERELQQFFQAAFEKQPMGPFVASQPVPTPPASSSPVNMVQAEQSLPPKPLPKQQETVPQPSQPPPDPLFVETVPDGQPEPAKPLPKQPEAPVPPKPTVRQQELVSVLGTERQHPYRNGSVLADIGESVQRAEQYDGQSLAVRTLVKTVKSHSIEVEDTVYFDKIRLVTQQDVDLSPGARVTIQGVLKIDTNGVCGRCKGTGFTTCPNCHGKGYIALVSTHAGSTNFMGNSIPTAHKHSQQLRCSTCGGRGSVSCQFCDKLESSVKSSIPKNVLKAFAFRGGSSNGNRSNRCYISLTGVKLITVDRDFRTWTSSTGKALEAKYVEFGDGKVKVKTETGGEFSIPVERLSKSDTDFVKRQEDGGDKVVASDVKLVLSGSQ